MIHSCLKEPTHLKRARTCSFWHKEGSARLSGVACRPSADEGHGHRTCAFDGMVDVIHREDNPTLCFLHV